jgi:hypothetical protein
VTRAGGGHDENVADHNAADAARGRSLGRGLLHVLRHIRRVPLVQHDVSVMAMALIAAFLIPIVLFFWLAFCLTVIAWLKALAHLCFGNFIQATIWFSIGCLMLFWWMGTDIDFDTWLHGSAAIVGMGALATFLRYLNRIRPPHTKPFKLRRSGYKTPANDNQLPMFSLQVKSES